MKRYIALLLIIPTVLSMTSCRMLIKRLKTEKEETTGAVPISETEEVLSEYEEETTVKLSEDRVSELDSVCKKYGATGAEVAIVKDNKLYSVYSYGTANRNTDTPVCEDTKYRVASLSKLVTDMIFMKLVDEGLADENENTETYLGCKVRNPRYPDTVITPKMLMLHTSSIVSSSEFLNARNAQSSVEIEKLLSYGSSYASYCPGTYYNYSNFGGALIGSICEKISGKCFEELAREYIFDPLGIDASYVASGIKQPELIGELYNNGGMSIKEQMDIRFCERLGQTYHIVQGNLTISAKDYAKILCVLLNDGVAENGKTILSKESVDKIKTAGVKDGSIGIGYGVQIQDDVVDGQTVFVHTGSNFGMFSTYVFCDSLNAAVVVLTSGADGSKNQRNMVYNVCDEIIDVCFDSVLQ